MSFGEQFRSKPGVNALVGMSTSKLRTLEIKLGLIQVVVVAGVVMGAMFCAFAFGYLSGENVGFERALSTSLANVARFPVVEGGRSAENGRDRAANIYAKLNAAAAVEPESLKEPELGKIKTTVEAPIADAVPNVAPAAAGVRRGGEDGTSSSGLDMNVLDEPSEEDLAKSDSGISVLGQGTSTGGRTLGALIAEDGEATTVQKQLPGEFASGSVGVRQEKLPIGGRQQGSDGTPKPQFAAMVTPSAAVAAPTPRPTIERRRDALEEPSSGGSLPAGWYAQVAAPQRREDANRLAGRLRASGFPVVVETAQVRGQQYFRVLAGPEKGRNQAEQLVGQLKRERYLNADPFIRMVK